MPPKPRRTFAEHLRHLRRSQRWARWCGPSQAQFAERFGLTFGAVKDAEQGRVQPSRALRVLVAAIELDASLIERAAVLAAERERVEQEAEQPQ